MSVYFTSDLHLGHALCARLRGFDSISDHDEAVTQSLLEVDGKRNILWVLGDVAMSKDSLKNMHRLESRLKLVRGNHDDFPEELYRNLFESIGGLVAYKGMWLSHCPIHPQEMYRYSANVHGHIHKDSNSPELPFPYINVNWDYWHRPVSLDELKEIIKKGG